MQQNWELRNKCKYGQLIFNKGARQSNEGKDGLSNKYTGTTEYPFPIKLKWIINLNVIGKNINYLKKLRRQATGWEKVIAEHISDKTLVQNKRILKSQQ